MCFMMLTRFVNVRVHTNTGAKGNLVTAERDLKILQFESPLSTSERLPKLIEVSKYVYMFERHLQTDQMFSEIVIIGEMTASFLCQGYRNKSRSSSC